MALSSFHFLGMDKTFPPFKLILDKYKKAEGSTTLVDALKLNRCNSDSYTHMNKMVYHLASNFISYDPLYLDENEHMNFQGKQLVSYFFTD